MSCMKSIFAVLWLTALVCTAPLAQAQSVEVTIVGASARCRLWRWPPIPKLDRVLATGPALPT